MLVDALSVPLRSEIGIGDNAIWPNPSIKCPGKRNENRVIDRRIDEIIGQVSPISSGGSNALSRIIPLLRNNYLTNLEIERIGEILWSKSENFTVLPSVGLFSCTLLLFPSPNPKLTADLVRKELFPIITNSIIDIGHLREIAAAATNDISPQFPNAEIAAEYFAKLSAWRPEKEIEENSGLGLFQSRDKSLPVLIGIVLSQCIAPSLDKNFFTEFNFKKLIDFYQEIQTPEILISFIYFAAASDLFAERVEKIIRQALLASESDYIG